MTLERSFDLLDPDASLQRPGARLLVLAPHPDDESLAAGGLIQRAIALGVPVGVVFASDGENNPWPQRLLERRLWIGPRQREVWADRRRGEAAAALHALGEPIHAVRLGWPDGGLTRLLRDATERALSTLRGVIVRARPTLLVMPGMGDRHPDHSALHVLTALALRGVRGDARPGCLGYVLHGCAHECAPCSAVFRLNAAERAGKRRAIEAHASQMALGRGRLLGFARGNEAFVAGLGGPRQRPARLPWLPHGRLLRRDLELLVVDAGGGACLRLGGGAGGDLRWRDGSPAARLPRAFQPPFYVKLCSKLPSPWIFDRWGWCRIDAPGA